MNDLGRGAGRGEILPPRCEEVREQLSLLLAHRSHGPDVGGEPDAVWPQAARTDLPDPESLEAHLAACPDCAAEQRFLERLVLARPTPPADLAARVVARALLPSVETGEAGKPLEPGVIPFRRPERAPAPTRWWTSPAAAAAVVVLAAGLGLVTRGMAPGPDGNGTLAAFDATSAGWWAEEWMVAGAPHLDGVSDEMLALLAAGIEP